MPSEPTDARRRILDASIALVAEQGVRAVSFREVARRAGVSHQTPYHHFGDHLGILSEIAREGFVALTTAMKTAAMEASGDPVKSLGAAGVAYVTFATTHVGHFRVMFQTSLIAECKDAPVDEAAGAFQALVQLVTRAHKAGAGRGVSVETWSQLAWSTVHGLSLLLIEGTLQRKQGEIDEQQVIRQVVSALGRAFRDTSDD